MKHSLIAVSAAALLASGLYCSSLAAEGQADRFNETRPYQNLDMMFEHIKEIHGPTSAGPGMTHQHGQMKKQGKMHHGAMHMHEDPHAGKTAHQRKRMVFGSNN